MGLEEIVWKRPQEILEVAKTRTLTSNELLQLKSASYYGPIRLLTVAMGNGEKPKEEYVRIMYALLRELDEGEDSTDALSKDDKTWAIGRLAYVIGEVVRKDPNGDQWLEGIIAGGDFRSVTEKLMIGAIDEETRIFVEHFGRGVVLKDLYEIGKEVDGKRIKEDMDYCVRSMTDGMIRFLDKGPIQTTEQLHSYCYYVAARIGSGFLNRLVKNKDGVQLNDERAEQFGTFLQLTNILKNVRKDYMEGRRFVPNALLPVEVSYEEMMEGISVDAREARQKALEEMLFLAEDNFQSSVTYVKSIPEPLSGYRAFCLVPLITATKTLEHLTQSGAEKVFEGEESAIKIPYGIGNIMDFSYRVSRHDNGKTAVRWLDDFAVHSEKFSFAPEGPEGYGQWSPKLLS